MGKFTKKVLRPRRTLAVTLDRPKTAALAFDRVYAPDDMGLPGEVTPGFSWLGKSNMVHVSMTRTDGTKDPNALVTGVTRGTLQDQLRTQKDALYKDISREGYHPVEFLDHIEQTYAPGNDRYIFAVLEGLVAIDEALLEWGQICEFRKDEDAFAAYRSLVGWFDKECKGMGYRQAEQHVCQTYENGRAALQKHGIIPAVGAVATLLGASLGPWFSPLPVWAAGVLTGASVYHVGAKILEYRLQRKESTRLYAPLAYIQKLETLESIRTSLAADHREELAAGRDY